MRRVSEVLQVIPLDYGPKYGNFGPDRIIAVSGFLTTKLRDFERELESLREEKVEMFHKEATRRGHASLLTSSHFYFWIKGSRMIDFYGTSFPFGSFIMFSSRRIRVDLDNLIFPDSFGEREKEVFLRTCKILLEFYKKSLETAGIDQARRILPMGFFSQGFFAYPMQTIVCMLKEIERDVFPQEIKRMVKKMEEFVGKKAPLLLEASREVDTCYHHPCIFTGTRIRKVNGLRMDFIKFDPVEGETPGITKLTAKFTFPISVCAWNELKRHRTVNQEVEGIYKAVERAYEDFEFVHVPPSFEGNEEYKRATEEALNAYFKLLDMGVPECEALYIVPQNVKLITSVLLNSYHVFHPFGFLGVRMCGKADYEIREIANSISELLSNAVPEIKEFLGPKCKTGVCPERKPCGLFKVYSRTSPPRSPA